MAKIKQQMGKYVDPRTDFGMKFYFGREENKMLLIEFLNSLFAGEKLITDLRYEPVELDGDYEDTRRVVFDLHCIGDGGEVFIIEMQQLFQESFKDHAVNYTSRLINKQIEKGRYSDSYYLPEVYYIGILDFPFNGKGRSELSPQIEQQYFKDVALCNTLTKEVLSERLGFKMISLPMFTKEPTDLKTNMDRWLYLLKHLSTMDKLPSFLDKGIFRQIFDIGEVGKLKEEDLMSYEASIKRKMDNRSTFSSVARINRAEGKAEGLAEGERKNALEIALKLKKMDFPREDIVKITGLTIEEIEKL